MTEDEDGEADGEVAMVGVVVEEVVLETTMVEALAAGEAGKGDSEVVTMMEVCKTHVFSFFWRMKFYF